METDSLIGKRLGNFRIERLIGRGGMASVYYAWDAKLQRPAAVKAIDVGQRDVAYARRLVQEARIIARWRHENISQVYSADQRDTLYFFAMEYIDGMDLGALMGRYHHEGELIPHADVVRIGRSVAHALDFAHQHGVIHRDVKPSNVMLAGDGRIVLTDFGLALDVEKGTVGEVLGTPHYIAPEQARDSTHTVPQSDLYALGVILYELLTGRVPFDDPSPMSVALMHMTEDPPLPTSLNPALNIPVEAVLLKAMSKSPPDRYQTGEQLMDAVEAALARGPSPAAGQPDERLRTPVAEVLVEELQTRSTFAARGTGDLSSAPVAMRRAYRNAASRRNLLRWALIGGGALIVVTVALVIALAAGWIIPARQTPQTTPLETSEGGGASAATAFEAGAAQPTSETSAAAPGFEASAPPSAILPADTPAPAEPTSAPAGGYRIILLYTDRGFYLFNPGDRNLEVANIAFEALDGATGQPTAYRFAGKSWAEFYSLVEKRNCVIVEIVGTSAYRTRPQECSSFNAQHTPSESSPEIFWIARPGIAEFRVLWAGQEVARCAIVSGRCEVTLPQG